MYRRRADTAHTKAEFTAFCLAFEETTPLEFHEIGALVPALKLVLLEEIAARGRRFVDRSDEQVLRAHVTPFIRTLQHVTQTSWKDELESLIPFDRILREDPAGAYAAMDIESRNVYRESVAKIAQRSDRIGVGGGGGSAGSGAAGPSTRNSATRALDCANRHIGYYLVGEGARASLPAGWFSSRLWRTPADTVAKPSR